MQIARSGVGSTASHREEEKNAGWPLGTSIDLNDRWRRVAPEGELRHAHSRMTDQSIHENVGESAAGPFGLALGAYALAELMRAERQLRHDGAKRHYGIHQARKSLRRARATLALAGSRFGQRARRADKGIRDIVRSLSVLRDAQVALDTLNRLTKDARPPLPAPALQSVRKALKSRRDTALRLRLLDDPGFADLRAKIARQHESIAGLDWASVRPGNARRALTASYDRLRKALNMARQRPDASRLHRCRRRLRRIRQQLTALKKAPGEVCPAMGIDTRLAGTLAWRQDLEVLAAALEDVASIDPATRRALREMLHGALDGMQWDTALG